MNVRTMIDIENIRKDFPILKREVNGYPLAYLDNGASAQRPAAVIDAIGHYYRMEHANVHRGVHFLSQEATRRYEEAREQLRVFINAAHDHEVLFTKGTTDSINLVANCFGRKFLAPGDEILITAMEHHSNIVPWQMICEEKGALLKVVPVADNGELEADAYAQLLNSRTRMVAMTHVSNTLGTINPVKAMIALAHERNIPVLLDGAQAVPHMAVDVQDLDVDFYTFSGHKMFGPTGVGILYGKEHWLRQMPPYQGGGNMIKTVSFEKTTYNTLPHKFEAGTPHIAGGIGLGEAARYLMQLGFDNIRAYEHELLEYATEKLTKTEGMRLIGTAPNKAAVLSFLIDGTHPYDVGMILDKLGIAVRTGHHCNQPLMDRFGIPGTIRASFAFYNTKAEIDRLAAGVERAVTMLQ